jgi:uncharacterized protein YlxW (UPF0749 family)
VPSQETQKPLLQRVDNILNSANSDYVVEEIENTAAVVILEELRKAEEKLKTLQERITRLRELLAKAQSAEHD